MQAQMVIVDQHYRDRIADRASRKTVASALILGKLTLPHVDAAQVVAVLSDLYLVRPLKERAAAGSA